MTMHYSQRGAAAFALPPAIDLLGNEPAGTGMHFAADQHYIRDPGIPANNRLATTADLITAGTMTFARASSAWGVGRLGYLQEFAAGVPRLVYAPESKLTSASNMQLRVGVKAITVSAGYAYAAGDIVALTDAGNTARWMRGRVISHVGTLLVVDVYWVAPDVSGSAASWVICKSLGYLAEGQATNKVTARKANPTDTTNMFKAGDAASILSVVDDSAALAAAGLSGICTSGKVYKLDNSAGTVNAYMQFFGPTGNTNVHVVSAHVRAVGGSVDARVRSNNLAGAAVPPGNGYVRASISFTPSGTGDVLWVQASPGQVTYAILPGLEEGSYATSVIAGDTLAAVTRLADSLSHAMAGPPEGTVVVRGRTAKGASTQTLLQWDDGTNNNRLIVSRSSTRAVECFAIVGGTQAVRLNMGNRADDTDISVAFSWRQGRFAASLDGQAAVIDTTYSGPLPIVSRFCTGHRGSGSFAADGTIASVRILPKSYDPADLQGMSAL